MKELTVVLDDEVYAAILAHAGGKRSISKFLNRFLPAAFAEHQPDLATLQREIRELRQELDALKQRSAGRPAAVEITESGAARGG